MKRTAQAVTEYVMLIVVVAAAIIAMNLYIQRAANDRLHNIELETNPAVGTIGVLGERVEDEPRAPEPGAPGARHTSSGAGTQPGSGSLPPKGWRDTDAGKEYCDRSGKCYPKEWMEQAGVTINEDGIVVSGPGVSISPQ